jgi:PAS domain S-box-containing protein
MGVFRNRRLLTKINLVVAVILLFSFALISFVNYRHQRRFVIDEAVQKARIVAYEAIRIREYVSGELQKGDVSLSLQRYGLIPVVAANRIDETVARDLDYRVRQISERYRNPKDAPDPFETTALQRFASDPQLPEVYAIDSRDDRQPVLRYLRPFKADQSCLKCHGDPADAPDFIKKLFPPGKDRAYHYRLGQVIGAVSISIPMKELSGQIAGNVQRDLGYTGGIFLALIVCLGLLTRVAVTRPLGRLGEAVREIIRTDRFEEKIPRRGQDEIGTLIDGFNEMIGHLKEKTAHLEDSGRQFRALTETARDGIVLFLANGQIILFNRQAEQIFGCDRKDVLGVSVATLIHEECRELHEQGIEEYLKHEGQRLVRDLYLVQGRRHDGAPLPLEVTLSVADSDGHLFYTAVLRPCS